MKILQVCLSYHPEIGGVEKHVSLISKELAKKHEVRILCTTKTPAGFEKSGVSMDGKITIERVPYKKLGYTPEMTGRIKSFKADAVHVHNYSTFQPFIVSKSVDKYVFTPHFHEQGKKPLIVRKFFDALFGHPSLRKASHLITVSDYEKKLLKPFNNSITTIPNPLELDKFSRIKKKTWNNHVLFIGRLEAYKNVDTLIKSVKTLSGIQLTILGSGPDEQRLKKTAGGDARIRFLGWVDEKKLLNTLAKADVLVNLSGKEAFGIVFSQALASGTPCIALDKGAVPTIFEKSILYSKNDVQDVSQKIQMVLQDPQLKNRLVDNGKKIVKNFDPKRVAEQTLKVYKT